MLVHSKVSSEEEPSGSGTRRGMLRRRKRQEATLEHAELAGARLAQSGLEILLIRAVDGASIDLGSHSVDGCFAGSRSLLQQAC